MRFWLALVSSVVLFIIIILLPFTFLVFNENNYFSLKDFSAEEKPVVGQTVSFLEGKSDVPPVFDESEASHLLDVRNLISRVILVFYLSLIIEGAIFFFSAPKPKELVFVFSASFLFILLLLIFLSSDFLSSFTFFHEIFFPQGNWQFPVDSALINLFPESFFYSFAQQILVYALLISFLLAVFSLIFYFFRFRKTKVY